MLWGKLIIGDDQEDMQKNEGQTKVEAEKWSVDRRSGRTAYEGA